MPQNAPSDSANVLVTSGTLNEARACTELHLQDGRVLRVRTAWLQEGSAPAIASESHFGVAPEDRGLGDGAADVELASADSGAVVIPVVEEQLEVGKRVVETGKVRLHKSVQTYETQLDEQLAVRTFDIERIVLNQPVESAPAVRHEGETTIYPLVEERLVLTRQLVLKEEVRVTRRDSERRDTQTVTLRREHLTVERESA